MLKVSRLVHVMVLLFDLVSVSYVIRVLLMLTNHVKYSLRKLMLITHTHAHKQTHTHVVYR